MEPLVIVKAETFLRTWGTFSRPAALQCDDGQVYIVKARQKDRPDSKTLANDHVVARLGMLLGAPVGVPMLVNVPQELIALQPELQLWENGISHGTRQVEHATERLWLDHHQVPENRPRFAMLAVLYGWACAADHQLIYANQPPYLVTSVDHGHFFPGGPEWQEASLQGFGSAELDQQIVSGCALMHAELSSALQGLEGVNDAAILRAVAAPPSNWGLSMDERVTLAQFFIKRRSELLSRLAPLA